MFNLQNPRVIINERSVNILQMFCNCNLKGLSTAETIILLKTLSCTRFFRYFEESGITSHSLRWFANRHFRNKCDILEEPNSSSSKYRIRVKFFSLSTLSPTLTAFHLLHTLGFYRVVHQIQPDLFAFLQA